MVLLDPVTDVLSFVKADSNPSRNGLLLSHDERRDQSIAQILVPYGKGNASIKGCGGSVHCIFMHCHNAEDFEFSSATFPEVYRLEVYHGI